MAIPFYKASTFTGLVSTKNYGTSEEWNSTFTTVKSNSAAWGLDTRSLWGSISGTLSAQTDLWSYLSAVGTPNFDIATLNNYLSTTPVLLSSLNVNGTILSAGVNLFDIFGSPADRLINGSYQVVLSSNGDLALPGAIVTTSNSKLDLVGFGPNTAYLTTTPDDSTALFMGANVAELRANTYVSIATNTSDITHLWEFGADGGLKFPDNTTQTTAFTGNPDQNKYIYTAISQNVLSNRKYAFDTSNSSLTATLPISPQIGDEIEFFDVTGYWFINNLVIANNGNYIEQKLETLECDVKFGSIQLIYVGPIDNIGWRIIPKPRHSVPSIISPIVSISSDISLGYDPIVINFAGINNLDSVVAPVNNWYWNLTGGNTPDYFTQNVSYNYSIPGIYTVNLTASNAVGIGTASKTITALPMLVPVPTISSNLVGLSGVVPLTASFIGLNTLPVSSSPVTNWYWNLTGGNTVDYTTQAVTYVYETSGSYVVNLSASNASGTGTTSVNVAVSSVVAPTIPSGYLAFWKLDDLADSSANGNTLTNNGSVQFVAGKVGNCAQFTGSNSVYLEDNSLTPTFNPSGPSGEFTVSCWVYPQSFTNYQAFLGSTGSGFIIHLDSAGNLYCNEAQAGDAQVNGILQLNQWQHIVFVKSVASGNRTKVWYNGSKVYDQPTQNINNYQSKTNITLGNYGSLSFPYNGRLDMVGLWNRELTQAEIDQLYNGGSGAEP